MTRSRSRRLVSSALVAAAAGALAIWPLVNHDAYKQNVLLFAFLIAVMAVGWNIISGFAGYVSLGQSAFIGIGAYTLGIIAVRHPNVSPWWWVPLGGVAAAAIAAVLGLTMLRTRGHSFVILTIAFLFIMQLIATNLTSLTGGATGITNVPLARYPREWQNTPFYYALLVLLAASVLLAWAIRRTKFGTGLIAIREDEDKAADIGVNAPVYKILAFTLSAVFVGMAGAVYGYYVNYIEPRAMFDIVFSVQAVLAALLGGRATIFGPVLGAFLIEFVTEATNDRTYDVGPFSAHVGGQWRLIVFGLLMAGTVLFLPRGIIPSVGELFERRRLRRAGAPIGALDLRVLGERVRPEVLSANGGGAASCSR